MSASLPCREKRLCRCECWCLRREENRDSGAVDCACVDFVFMGFVYGWILGSR